MDKKEQKIDDKELKKKFNEYSKIRMRLKKHGDANRVDKAGRKAINRSTEEKKEMQRQYYQNVIKPKLQKQREQDLANKPPKVKTSEEKRQKNRRYYLEVVKPKLQAKKLEAQKLKELIEERNRLKKLLEEQKNKNEI